MLQVGGLLFVPVPQAPVQGEGVEEATTCSIPALELGLCAECWRRPDEAEQRRTPGEEVGEDANPRRKLGARVGDGQGLALQSGQRT